MSEPRGRPPCPQMRRAASAKGSPKSLEKIHTQDSSLATSDLSSAENASLANLSLPSDCLHYRKPRLRGVAMSAEVALAVGDHTPPRSSPLGPTDLTAPGKSACSNRIRPS